jgi:uncharacterized protein
VLFEWDERKNATNRRKHGVSFEVATAAFSDPMHVMRQDRVVNGEIRWTTVGEVRGKYLLVCHTLIEEDEEIVRIISAREATAHERREYEEGSYC